MRGGCSSAFVVRQIESGSEYLGRVVDGVFRSVLGRPADAGALSYYVSVMKSAAPATSGLSAQDQVKAQVLSSPEYFQEHGGSNAAFVDALYADMLQRPSDSGGAAYYGSLLTQGKSRAEVAQLVLRSTEAKQVLVHGFYQTYF